MTTKVETKIGISEIFLSIQGEGLYTGEPTIFVRFQGCDLGCTWCDSKYTWKPESKLESKGWTSEEILNKVVDYDKDCSFGPDWVCITGGEPLQQLDGFCDLVLKLNKACYKVEVETSGLVSLPRGPEYNLVNSWVVDLKLPSSRVTLSPIVEDFGRLRTQDQLKVIISDGRDLFYANDILTKNSTAAKVLISPMFNTNGKVGEKLLRDCVDFCLTHNYRLSLQTHKYIWGMKRGV